SNFERFIYLLVGRDSEKLNQLWHDVNSGKGFDLADLLGDAQQKFGFASGKSTHADRLATIQAIYTSDQDLLDPHTADGVKVALDVRKDGEVIVCAETALPAKFAETITEAVGEINIPRPAHTQNIESLPQKVVVFANDANLVRGLIEQNVAAK
ncbi:MAG: threonine synthase, partial [Acinetobacter sp.]|nr:threonine synthase [Acinetobacter sp.]